MKKSLTIIIGAVALWPVSSFAAVTSTFVLPENFGDGLWAQVNGLFQGINIYVTIIVGTILATVLLEILIGALKKPGN